MRSSDDPLTQSVPTAFRAEKAIEPVGMDPCDWSDVSFLDTASRCLAHVTPTMYSPSFADTVMVNSGGLGHCFPFFTIEHLSGSIRMHFDIVILILSVHFPDGADFLSRALQYSPRA